MVGTAFDLRCLLSVSGRKSSALKCAAQTFFLPRLKACLLILASQASKMLTLRFYSNQCYAVFIYLPIFKHSVSYETMDKIIFN